MTEKTSIDIKHILYATDFSANAESAFPYAASLANQYGAKLTMLHVVHEELLDLLVFDVGIERPESVKKRLELEKDRLRETREAFIKKAETEYCCNSIDAADILVEKGNPVKTILRLAEERNCDLIVMGMKGGGRWKDAIMGNTVRRVIQLSKLPVLVVQNPEEK
jgi:nucleotide-binding universal stress UspA family protein